MEPVRTSDDLWKPRARKCKTYRSIDAARLLSGLIESDQSLAFCFRMIFSENKFPLFRDHPLEPRDLELALFGDALESFTGTLDTILIIGAV